MINDDNNENRSRQLDDEMRRKWWSSHKRFRRTFDEIVCVCGVWSLGLEVVTRSFLLCCLSGPLKRSETITE